MKIRNKLVVVKLNVRKVFVAVIIHNSSIINTRWLRVLCTQTSWRHFVVRLGNISEVTSVKVELNLSLVYAIVC